MTARIFSFLRRSAAPSDWSAQELAEFYRVESNLIQSGLLVVTDRGLTDEGEPWFVFCRAEDDEVIIHFARIDGRYLISAPAYCGTAVGRDFRTLVRSTLESHPVLQPQRKRDNLFLHPAALLVVLVASALLKSGHATEAALARPTAADVPGEKHRDAVAAMALAPITAKASVRETQQYELLDLAAVAAAMAEPVTSMASATAQLPDVGYQPHHQLTELLDESNDVQTAVAGSVATAVAGSMAPVVPPHQLVVASDAAPAPLAYTALQPDVGSVLTAHSSLAGQTVQIMSAALSDAAPSSASVVAVPSFLAGVHLVSLSTLSGIPKADLDLLHALGVPDNVVYTPTAPVALSTVIQAGVLVVRDHPTDEHASYAGDATAAGAPWSAPATAASTAQVSVVAEPGAGTIAASTAQVSVVAEPGAGTIAASTAHVSVVAAPGAATTAAGAPVITAPSIAPAAPNMSVVLATVEQFQAVSTHPVVVLTDHAAIFYDAAAVTTNLSVVKSFTYDFGDGFSISLVGLPAELAHIGIHV